jgi:DNA polymerase III subunit delta
VAPPPDNPDIVAAVARGKIEPIYCLAGERYLRDTALAAIRAAVLAEAGAAASFNHDVFDLKEKGLAAALATAQTLPMMARRRLVVGKGIDDLRAADLDPLVAYADDPNPATCLVLVADKIDTRLKAFGALKKRGALHVFAAPRDNALPSWIRAEAKARKIDITPDAAQALAAAVGAELGRLAHTLDQLSLYVGGGRPIGVEDVDALVAETREHGVFELGKAIGNGDVPRAMALLANMLRNREPALRIQFMIARQLRQIWRAKELAATRASRNDIAAAVGIPPFFVDDVLVPAKRMSKAALERAFEHLYQADLGLKTARIEHELVLGRLVERLAQDAAGRG